MKAKERRKEKKRIAKVKLEKAVGGASKIIKYPGPFQED